MRSCNSISEVEPWHGDIVPALHVPTAKQSSSSGHVTAENVALVTAGVLVKSQRTPYVRLPSSRCR